MILWLGCSVPAWGQGADSLVAVPRPVAVQLLGRSLRVAVLDSLMVVQREELRLVRLGLRASREEALGLWALADTLDASVRDLRAIRAAQTAIIRQQAVRLEMERRRARWWGRLQGVGVAVVLGVVTLLGQ